MRGNRLAAKVEAPVQTAGTLRDFPVMAAGFVAALICWHFEGDTLTFVEDEPRYLSLGVWHFEPESLATREIYRNLRCPWIDAHKLPMCGKFTSSGGRLLK